MYVPHVRVNSACMFVSVDNVVLCNWLTATPRMRGTVWGAAGHRGRIRYGMGVAAEILTFCQQSFSYFSFFLSFSSLFSPLCY